jgi:sugar phosphate isomerase/epimerase
MNTIIVFTKFLQDKSVAELIRLAHEHAVEGYDLCVRPGYVVNPENAAEALVPAVRAMRQEGLDVPMVTTSPYLVDPEQPDARPLLEAMARAEVPFLKLGYFPFDAARQDYWQEVDGARRALQGWERLGRECGVRVCYHTHSRGFLGVNCASLMHLIQGFDPAWIGAFVDPTHLVIEGEEFPLGISMVKPYLSIVSVKDVMLTRKETAGHSEIEFEVVPAGTGMVDFDSVFRSLRSADYSGPLTAHCEFEHDTGAVFLAKMKHEVEFSRQYRETRLAR